jgi:predicted nucleotidyltransferase
MVKMNRAISDFHYSDPDFSATAGKQALLHTLVYFDIFHYPLRLPEILQFSSLVAEKQNAQQWLQELVDAGTVYQISEFFLLRNDPGLCTRRMAGNRQADILLKKANRIGRFLYRFPFVRAVGISGSLSKGYADKNADIDFFIITAPNRLWIARTFMHLFKKLSFLVGRQHYYCMNYYIDETALSLEEKNIFTAIELKTLLPVSGSSVMNLFFKQNGWANDFLPACAFRQQKQAEPGRILFKKLIEWILGKKFGQQLEGFLMRLTRHRWNKKEERGKKNMKGDEMGLISGIHFARSDPGMFQVHVLQTYQQRITAIERKEKLSSGKLFPL